MGCTSVLTVSPLPMTAGVSAIMRSRTFFPSVVSASMTMVFPLLTGSETTMRSCERGGMRNCCTVWTAHQCPAIAVHIQMATV